MDFKRASDNMDVVVDIVGKILTGITMVSLVFKFIGDKKSQK